MRWPSVPTGKTPSTCRQCRDARPEESWCNFHDGWHPRSAFGLRPEVAAGVNPDCREAASIRLSQRGGYPPIPCPPCGETKPSHRFRGGQSKAVACKECEDRHPGLRWCPDHAAWLPLDRFTPTGAGGRFPSVRCNPCRTANTHGVTIGLVLERQGVPEPECAACGVKVKLVIDHDHKHCPGPVGCSTCVRGYLCHPCNTAEGLLRTPGRARALADYMERHGGF